MTRIPNKYDKIIEELKKEIEEVKGNFGEEELKNIKLGKSSSQGPVNFFQPGKEKKTKKEEDGKISNVKVKIKKGFSASHNAFTKKCHTLLNKMKNHFELEKKGATQIVFYEKKISDIKKNLYAEYKPEKNKSANTQIQNFEKELSSLYTQQGQLRQKRILINKEITGLIQNDPEKANPCSEAKFLLNLYKFYLGSLENLISESRLYQIQNDNELKNHQIDELTDQITFRDEYIIKAEQIINKYEALHGKKSGQKEKKHVANFMTKEELEMAPYDINNVDNYKLENADSIKKSFDKLNKKAPRNYKADLLPLIAYNRKVNNPKLYYQDGQFLSGFKVKKLNSCRSTGNLKVQFNLANRENINSRIKRYNNKNISFDDSLNDSTVSKNGFKSTVNSGTFSLCNSDDYKKTLKNFLTKDIIGRYHSSPYINKENMIRKKGINFI
ncbi:MAG: hypothetical protein MJ252_20475 [archaeon]|nr:hypothetical protein [archaeon]